MYINMGKISPIKQNILKYLDYKGLTKYKFYQQTGISRGVLDKDTGLNEDNLAKVFATYSEINPIWLTTGNGEMLIVNDKSEINEPIESYTKECKGCKEKDKQIEKLQNTIDNLLEESKKDRELIRSLVSGNSDGINKQSHCA